MNTRWTRVAALIVAAELPACGLGSPEPMHPLGPTLLIVNESTFVYRVTVGPSLVVVVGPGQSKCVWAGRENEARRMEFFPLAGPVAYYSPYENLMTASGWVVEIAEAPKFDLHSLRPTKRCKDPIIEPDSAETVEPPSLPPTAPSDGR